MMLRRVESELQFVALINTAECFKDAFGHMNIVVFEPQSVAMFMMRKALNAAYATLLSVKSMHCKKSVLVSFRVSHFPFH